MPETDVRILDVSASEVSIDIEGPIRDFLDEGNPIEVSDTETTNIEWSCNGRMIRTIKPAAVMVSVTVIPGSDSDEHLFGLWKNGFSNGGDGGANANQQLTGFIRYVEGGTISLSNGTCISGPAGCTVQGSGKLGGNTYTFAFEVVN